MEKRGPKGRGRAARAIVALAATVMAAAAAEAVAGTGKCAGREGDPDCALYVIARKCIDTEAPDYCTACPAPRPGYCPEKRSCEESTVVWAGSSRLVAVADRSTCACPEVAHGLVMPTGAVSGIEDVDRPLAIWKFAWTVAAGTLPEDQIALIVSSPSHRTQSQLHVHILPLAPYRASDLEATTFGAVTDLYRVWETAEAVAATKGLKPFGVLVHRAGDAWHVHVEEAPLTERYTLLPECGRHDRRP